MDFKIAHEKSGHTQGAFWYGPVSFRGPFFHSERHQFQEDRNRLMDI
jgi:hypothetical protein